jgi:ATP-binding cassette subfamily B protein
MNDAAHAAAVEAPQLSGVQRLRHLRMLWRFVAPYRWRMAGAAIALIAAAGSFLVIGQGLKRVIDLGFARGDAAALNHALIALLGVIILLACATYVRFYLVSWLGERAICDLRRAVFAHLLELSPSFFERTRTGEMVSRLTADTTLLEQVIGSSVSMAVRNSLLGIGSLILLALTSAKLTVFVLLTVPVLIGPILLFGRRVRRLSRASQDRVADLGAYVDETLHEIRTVQAYGHQTHDREHFGERVDRAFATALKRVRQRAALIAAVIVLLFGGVGLILWAGGQDVLNGKLSAGELSAFVFYAAMLAGSAAAISEVVGDLQRGAGAAERLLEVLNARSEIESPAEPVTLPLPSPATVELQAVTFCYPSRPAHAALVNCSVQVRKGERVALVGPSGAGKSTVFQLLMRFYDPNSGTVRVDGVDLRTADPRAVRARIALVPQEPAIFASDVRYNVAYARPEASFGAIRAACEASFAAEFIDRLPQGYETELGERGVRLSGGQRQRLAIARAILSDRPILLLDEATSALDAHSESMVQAALERLMHGRTTLIIAHRLATVRSADWIAVLDHGRLLAVGRHDELLTSSELYARLAALQFAGE